MKVSNLQPKTLPRTNPKDLVRGYNLQPSSGGFITLMSVIVMSAIGIAIGTAILLIGLGSSKTSLAIIQSNQSKGLANTCAERALELIRETSFPSGSGGLTLGQGTCAYTVINLGGQNREIDSTGTVSTIVRKVKVILNKITPKISLTSWQEVAN